jgi:hypothetical protein
VEAVLLDTIRRSSAGCAFPAKSPADLIDGDVIGPFELRSRELESGGERSAPAADHRDLYGSVGRCAAKSFFFVLAHAGSSITRRAIVESGRATLARKLFSRVAQCVKTSSSG